MKIAIIGSGISGLAAAYYLNKKHNICLYEADSRLGGHTATKDIYVDGKSYAIDTGFIVFNDWTYPNFIRLLDKLKVESEPTTMGFSVFRHSDGFEYAGTNFFTLFAQKRNLFSPVHWRMLKDILRFNKEAIADLDNSQLLENESIGNYLQRKKYSAAFIDHYLVPMGSAIWSATHGAVLNFPLEFFLRFFKNHGLLNVVNRPQWRVIKGGSNNYIPALIRSFDKKIKLSSPVTSIKRHDNYVLVTSNGTTEIYDQVIIASHSDQALGLLEDASMDEKDILGAISYQKNSVVLHTDQRMMPRKKATWSSWNYQLQGSKNGLPILTYAMNILQNIISETHFFVTLNASEQIDPSKILGQYEYSHPVFSQSAIQAQQQWQTINGVNRTWFCGAYWHNGFHEDGVNSARRVATALGVNPDD